MYRYTVLQELDEFKLCTKDFDLSKLKGNLISTFTELELVTSCNAVITKSGENLLVPFNFINDKTLLHIAKANLYTIYEELFPYVEIDIYNIINFTCDYLLSNEATSGNNLKKSYITDAISYWEKLNDDFDPDGKIRSTYYENCKKLKLPFEDMIIVETTGQTTKKVDPYQLTINVHNLCANYSKYVVKNIKKLYFYGKNNSDNKYDAFLLDRFLDVENCNFEDSDYYILECLTNINSVITIVDFLSKIVPNTVAEGLMYGKIENSKFKKELDNLINIVAKSPLVFSKSLMLYKLFEEVEQIFDLVGEINYALRYVTEQFTELNNLFTYGKKGIKGVQERFSIYYENFDHNLALKSEDYCIKSIKNENQTNFKKNLLNNYEWIMNDKLIKNKYVMPFKCNKKANSLYAYLNVYVQKKFINQLDPTKKPQHSF